MARKTPEPTTEAQPEPATTCTGAPNCSARIGRWKRATDLAGNATTVTTDDGGMWNRACLATGCPVRTYI